MLAQTDLTPLFAPPSAQEIVAARAEWASRFPVGAGLQVDLAGVIDASGREQRVVSHVIDGSRHYALMRLPAGYTPSSNYPIVLCLHGGTNGVTTGIFGLHDQLAGSGACAGRPAILLAPSFRAETATLAGQVFLSQGTSTEGDRDVDDVIALLDAILAQLPGADADHVVAWGFSRGGNATLRLLAREHRVRAGCDFFGSAMLFTAERQAGAEAFANQGGCDTPDPVDFDPVCAFLDDPGQLAASRQTLILKSGALHIEQATRVDIHHGVLDPLIPIEQSRILTEWAAAASPSVNFRSFEYPTGVHSVQSLDGAPARFREFLCEAYELPPPCSGDIDLDEQVGAADLAILLARWGEITAISRADITRDHLVNGADLSALLGNWGVCGG